MLERNSQSQSNRKCLLVVDSTNTFLRGYAANRAVADGEHVGGIVSYVYTVRTFITKRYSVDAVCCVWDGPEGSMRRRSIYKEYKEGRRPKRKNRFHEFGHDSNSVAQQLALINILDTLPVRQFSVIGCEADDVIAYICNKHSETHNIVIMSTDKDYYQLISPSVVVYNPVKKKGTYIRTEEVLAEFKIHPRNFAMARAVVGDPSDNIKGIEGVGFKTLVKYCPFFADGENVVTLQMLFEKLEQIEKPNKTLLKMINGYGIIERNYKLMRLDVSMLSIQQLKEIESTLEEEPTSDLGTLRTVLVDNGLIMGSESLHDSFAPLCLKTLDN